MNDVTPTAALNGTDINKSLGHALEHHLVLSRRGLLAVLGALLMSASQPSEAYAYTQYSTVSMGAIWNLPPRPQLSQNSNLFLPGDAPRSAAVGRCSGVNRSTSLNTANSYWGTDFGLVFQNSNQFYWPWRRYSYGLDAFSYEACANGSWHDQTIDSLTNFSLENNSGGCGAAGYEAHQIVSYSVWEVPGFGGGVIPTILGVFSLHNVEGNVKGTYGQYICSDFEDGEVPPDFFCAAEGYGSMVEITCFSVRALSSADNYVLLYCLYACVRLNEQNPILDNYGGTTWATALAARLRCGVTANGLDTVASVLANNICKRFQFDKSSLTIVQRAAALTRQINKVAPSLEASLDGCKYTKSYDSANEAAQELYYVLFHDAPSKSDISRIAAELESSTFGAVVRSELERSESQQLLEFPLRIPSLICSIDRRDAGNNLRTIQTDETGEGYTPYVFNRGTYQSSLSSIPSGWTLVSKQDSVTIPDTGSGQCYSFEYSLNATSPQAVKEKKEIRYFRDFEAMTKLGKSALCFSEKAEQDIPYTPRTKEETGATRLNCSWDGWYLDPACTNPYKVSALEDDLDLFCMNWAQISWDATYRAKELEEDYGERLCTDEALYAHTSIAQVIPESTTVAWNGVYALPDLPTLYWMASNEVRSSEGRIYRDPNAKREVTNGITVTSNTKLYADWRPAIYDGIHLGS